MSLIVSLFVEEITSLKPRLSLRTLFACIFFCALASCIAGRALRQARAVKSLRNMGVTVEYASACKGNPTSVVRRPPGGWSDPSLFLLKENENEPASRMATAIDDALGMDLCRRVASIEAHWMENPRIVGRDLGALIGLRRIEIAFTPLNDPAVTAICECRSLKQLAIRQDECMQKEYRAMTATQIERVCSALEELQQLNLEGCGITDDMIQEIVTMRGLQECGLGANRVSDKGIAELSVLRNLKALDVGRTDITDAGLLCLRSLRELNHLDLRLTQVTDNSVALIKSFEKLRYLDVRGTNITLAAIHELEDHFAGQCVIMDSQRVAPIGKRASPQDRFDYDYVSRMSL